ncbi:hypothetical protein GIB67_004488, partial [Kingdonia uniflora]
GPLQIEGAESALETACCFNRGPRGALEADFLGFFLFLSVGFTTAMTSGEFKGLEETRTSNCNSSSRLDILLSLLVSPPKQLSLPGSNLEEPTA